MTEDKVAVTLTLDTAEFMAQLRRSVFAMYQASQWHGWPDRYHFGIRAREIGGWSGDRAEGDLHQG